MLQNLVFLNVFPILTRFCKELTHIKQDDVDNAVTLSSALHKLGEFVAPYKNRFTWGSWGQYDSNQLEKEVMNKNIANYPLKHITHVNLSIKYANAQGGKKRGLSRALRQTGLEFIGTPHRAYMDAVNTARLMPFIYPRQSIK